MTHCEHTLLGGRGWSLRKPRRATCRGFRRLQPRPPNRPYSLFSLCALCALVVSSSTGCQQKMAEQPSYRPLRPSEFFDDGRSARPLVSGTVPYSPEPDMPALTTGRAPNADSASTPLAEFVAAFPFSITKADLQRGRERFTIFCALCHDAAGTGHGKIVERGYTMPPSYHTSNSRGLER